MVTKTGKSKVERIRPLEQETDNSPCAVESNAFDGNKEPKHEINAKKTQIDNTQANHKCKKW